MRSITACVVAYNSVEDLNNSLKSILGQTYPVSEVIVVDNSVKTQRDKMKNVVNDFQTRNIHYFEQYVNTGSAGGFARAMELGLKADANYIWLNDADGVPESSCLKELVLFSEQIEEPIVTTPFVYNFRGELLENFRCRLNPLGKGVGIKDVRGNKIVHYAATTGILVDSIVVRNVGVYDSERFFVGCEDIDWCIRVRKKGYKIYAISSARYYHPELWNKRNHNCIKKNSTMGRYFPVFWGELTIDNTYVKKKIIESRIYITKRYFSSFVLFITFVYSFVRVFIRKFLNSTIDVFSTIKSYKDNTISRSGRG